jgi:WD40 repeat protein
MLWKCDGGKPAEAPTHDVAAHAGWVEAVAFSPDGKRLASVGADCKLHLRDVTGLTIIRSVSGHSRFPRDLIFSPDGKTLISSGEDGLIIIRNSESLEIIRTIDTGLSSDQQGQTPAIGGIIRLSISADGRFLLASGDRQSICYDFSSGSGIAGINQAGGDALFGHRESVIAAGENTLRVWSFAASEMVPVPVPTPAQKSRKESSFPAFKGKEIAQIKRGEFSMGAAFSPDDRFLAVGRNDGTVELFTLS